MGNPRIRARKVLRKRKIKPEYNKSTKEKVPKLQLVVADKRLNRDDVPRPSKSSTPISLQRNRQSELSGEVSSPLSRLAIKLTSVAAINMPKEVGGTLIHALTEAHYYRLTAIRKGVLSVEDRKKRVTFARDALKRYDTGFWSEKVLLYLDGVSFVYKSNPCREAVSAQGKVYRRKNEGLRVTAKGTKNLAGGRRIHFLVGISSGSGVVVVEEYTKMQGHYFAKFVQNTLHSKLLELAEMKGREELIFVMDNDPCQTSNVAHDAVDE